MNNQLLPIFSSSRSSFMSLAYEQAKKALDSGEIPVGAVIVYDNQVISQAHNAMYTQKNPLAHAEMLAIQQACKQLGTPYLTNCVLYVTLEPCALCAAAIALIRLPTVYFGAYDPKGGAVDHNACIFKHSLHKPDVYGGIQERRCGALLTEFFKKLRAF